MVPKEGQLLSEELDRLKSSMIYYIDLSKGISVKLGCLLTGLKIPFMNKVSPVEYSGNRFP
ncbi:MAG: hypothetical protein DF168_01769 [Candidatus Moanabacter tarae]|mgnify:CR=1 FL=1|uniref:Uncharacterized protein n=1 Tax=Candidatus Moanibacter tarae TaxID=2200854 RepID=A0A2Z4AJE4_9BACT|nr:MAG: hypothetical protein DF168_01769 [Candidatus Moanabacter tarae]